MTILSDSVVAKQNNRMHVRPFFNPFFDFVIAQRLADGSIHPQTLKTNGESLALAESPFEFAETLTPAKQESGGVLGKFVVHTTSQKQSQSSPQSSPRPAL